MIDKDLLEILACPLTKQPLRVATAAEVAAWNASIAAGKLKNAAGKPAEPFEEALVRQDGKVVYAIRDRIPVLLPDEGIAV
jgi:uncharacterized protein YbaR (Trm112 family)